MLSLGLVLSALALTSCGLILGDAEHWFPGPVFRAAAWLLVGVGLGYAGRRWARYERREDRRDDR